MKLASAILIASIAGASAFTTPSTSTKASSVLRSSDQTEQMSTPSKSTEIEAEIEEKKPALPKMSQSLPFMERPAMLDGSLPGDVGFDPFGFAKSKADLMNYREAEIKHARLAMLAAAGWPLSELFDRKLATLLNLAPLVDANDRAPSLLNGGLGKVSPIYWIACIAGAAAIDFYGISKARKNEPGYFPGNLGFDPIGVYPKDEAGKKRMQLAEIKNGRLAMIAITAFAFQEFVTKFGVVDETPIFFKPIGEVLHQYTNSGYYVPN